jgi:hypothetical protein
MAINMFADFMLSHVCVNNYVILGNAIAGKKYYN